jgi:hypothetical protein
MREQYKGGFNMLVRIYTGPDGQSHFEDLTLPTPESHETSLEKTTGAVFRRQLPDLFIDWHPAPRRQYVITLSGATEIGIGDGTVRRFGPGDVLLAEDLTGQGHTTRIVGGQPRISMTVQLMQ